jgi:murein DD-endopeptidase MepM/ murein hydrolase activator NlpD
MLWNPLKDVFEITQKFGENPEFYKKFGMKGHNGIDLRTKFKDTPLGKRYCYASLEGVVIKIGNDPNGYGIYIRLSHQDGAQTIYAHLEKVYVKLWQKVKQGQLIGLTDNTGFSTGAHLHFGFRPEGWWKNYNNGYFGYVDPLPYITKKTW